MPEKIFKIYRSSAGSGKTYTLAVEYLLLVLKNPHLTKNILAVTFTNKATQEMKERILAYLHHLATTEIKDNFYQDIQAASMLPDEQLKLQAATALQFILHNFSYFSINTIDSFFQKVIRGFTREIGLHGNFNLELDHEKVLLELIDLLIEEVGENKRLTQWLIRFAENNVMEGKSWDVRRNMLSLSSQIFTESFKSIENEVLNQENLVDDLLNKTSAIRNNFEKRFNQLAESAFAIADEYNLAIEDFAYGKSGGVLSYFAKILHRQDYEPGSRIYSMRNIADKWFTKTSKRKEDILQAFGNGLNQKLNDAISHYESNATTYYTATELQRYIYVLGLLSDLSRKLKDYREENETTLMSDASHLLRQLIGTNDAPYIYEKIGSAYHHFFIDEFQDTSGFQWDNFAPLITNSLAQGRKNLVVGDVKQSIYRWRGGNWELLLRQLQKDVGEAYVDELNLQKNYRSLFNIINFNNKFFTLAPIYLHKMLQSQTPTFSMSTAENLQLELAKIIEAYQDVWQEAPARVMAELQKGYVKAEFIAQDKIENEQKVHWREIVLQNIPKTIEKLQDQNYKLQDIMILVRRQEEGREIIDEILKYKKSSQARKKYQYEIISSESLYLENASSIKIIIAVFRWLLDSDDRVNISHLAADYQQVIMKRENLDWHHLFATSDNIYQFLPEKFESKKPLYLSQSLYEVAEQVIRDFDLQMVQDELAYQHTFLDQLLNFNNLEGSDLNHFLIWWEQKGRKTSIQMPDQIEAIRLFTIHKAKGLQAKVVLIPFCEWSLDHNATFDNIIWCQDRSDNFPQLKFYPIKYTQSLSQTWFQLDYAVERIKAMIDNLNLLYVAFTRAEKQLLISAPQPKIDKKGNYDVKSIADLVYFLLKDHEGELKPYFHEPSETFEMGNPVPDLPSKSKNPESKEVIPVPSAPWQSKISIRKSAISNPARKQNDKLLDKKRYGQIIHHILSHTTHLKALDKIMLELYYKGIISRNDQEQIKLLITAFLQNEAVKKWFDDEKWQVKTEMPILDENGNTYRPDRVLLKENQVVVIDYKTGKANDKDLKQVKEYLQLLHNMGYKVVEGYIAYVLDGKIEEVKI